MTPGSRPCRWSRIKPADEVAVGCRAGTVDDAGIERHDRQAVGCGAPREIARRHFGALVMVRGQRMRTVGGRKREKRRGVDRCAMIRPSAPPRAPIASPPTLIASNSDGSRRQTATSAARWQIASDRSAALRDGACVANVARRSTARVGMRASREHDRLVARRRRAARTMAEPR